jgi:hypothetical protein
MKHSIIPWSKTDPPHQGIDLFLYLAHLLEKV